MPSEILSPKKVLIVDDDPMMRILLKKIISSASDLKATKTATGAESAHEQVLETHPDVITLDVQMPRTDGLTFLSEIMNIRPTPVVMVSAFTETGADSTIAALELGAVDFITKPNGRYGHTIEDFHNELVAKVRMAAVSKARKWAASSNYSDIVLPASAKGKKDVIAIGSSMGGLKALHFILPQLPRDFSGVVVAQHMPHHITKNVVERLNEICKMEVKEAEKGDLVLPGRILIAPGGQHMTLRHRGFRYCVDIHCGPQVNFCRPSVDVLFNSVAETVGEKASGIILTGMGRDGAEGLARMKSVGAFTIAQNEETCVIFGMPRAAIDIGAVDEILPLEEIFMSMVTV